MPRNTSLASHQSHRSIMDVRFFLLVVVLYQSYCSTKAAKVNFICPDETVPLFRYAQYTCSISGEGGVLQWRIIDSGPGETIPFSTASDNVGQNRFSNEFLAILTSETDGITSQLSFVVEEEHNNIQIICEDPSTGNMSLCYVNITGSPAKILSVDDDPISLNTTLITWIGLPAPFIILNYEVWLNNGSSTMMFNESDTSIEINMLQQGVEYNVVIIAVDNADRPGVPSDPLIFILDCPANNSDTVKASALQNGSDYTIIVSWISDDSSRPDVSDYHITYTIGKGNAVSDTTNDTRYVIPDPVNSTEPIEFILIAENVLCTTVLYNSNITVGNVTNVTNVTVVTENTNYLDELIGVSVALTLVIVVLLIVVIIFSIHSCLKGCDQNHDDLEMK